jgi:hypothetical protein
MMAIRLGAAYDGHLVERHFAKRAIRMIMVKTKISGQFKSLHQEFAILRSVIDTTIKNRKSVFQAIQCLVNCQPKAAE